MRRALRMLQDLRELIDGEPDRDRLTERACSLLVARGGYRRVWLAVYRTGLEPLHVAEPDRCERLPATDLPPCLDGKLGEPGVVTLRTPAVRCTSCRVGGERPCEHAMSARMDHAGEVFGLLAASVPEELLEDPDERSLFQTMASDLAHALRALEAREERVFALEEITRANQMHRALFDSAAEGIAIVDAQSTRFVQCNRAFSRLLGYSMFELMRMSVADILTPDAPERARSGFRAQPPGEEAAPEIIPFRTKDSAIIYAHVNATTLDLDGRECSVGFFTDVTERYRAEQELLKAHQELRGATLKLLQSAKLSAMGELAASLVHELNQPLNAIGLIAQAILRSRRELDWQQVEDDVRELLEQVTTMSEIVEHTRVFARTREGTSLVALNVGTVVDRALKFMRVQLLEHGIELVTRFAPGLPEVRGDVVRLEQVFLNLVANARNALDATTRAHKRIELRASQRRLPDGQLEPYVLIEVEDNGIGIPPDTGERIFEPFYTTMEETKGTGLGLSVTRRIVEEHGGEIAFESQVNEGTVFRVSLPVAADDALHAKGGPA